MIRTIGLGSAESRREVALLSTSPGLVVLDNGDEVRVHSFREHPGALEKAVGS